jgi:FAD/FMN-containing dehydrogenase
MAGMTKALLEKEQGPVPGCLGGGSWAVYVSFEGSEKIVKRVARDLERLVHEAGARKYEPLDEGSDSQSGGVLREAFEWLRWAAPTVALFRITLPRITPEAIAALNQTGGSLRRALLVRARGVIYLSLMGEREDEKALGAFEKAAEDIFALAAAKQGHATLLHALRGLKQRPGVWGPTPGDLSLMKRLKQAFDPDGIFAPGRCVGGL